MEYEDFVKKVGRRAGIGSYEEAEAATRATIAALGKHMAAGGERLDLASELPPGLAEHFDRQPPKGGAEEISYSDFLQRVGQGEGVSEDEAAANVRAVMAVLREAIGEGDMEKVRQRFPGEYGPMFADAR